MLTMLALASSLFPSTAVEAEKIVSSGFHLSRLIADAERDEEAYLLPDVPTIEQPRAKAMFRIRGTRLKFRTPL